MFVMEWPGTNALQPGSVLPLPLAEVALDRTIDEYPRHARVLRGEANEFRLPVGPACAIDLAGLRIHQDRLLDTLSLAALQRRQIQSKPDIHIQPSLMTCMVIRHGPAARLSHVAHQHRAEACLVDATAPRLDVIDQVGMAVMAVALQLHCLITDAIG